MKTAVLLLFAASALAFADTPAQRGCGPAEQKWVVEAKKISDFKAPVDENRATVVYVHDSLSGPFRLRIGIDGQWMAATAHNTFTAFETPPGEHKLCVGLRQMSYQFRLNAKPGKVYFVGVVQPVFLGPTRLEIIQEDNAYNQIARMKLAVSHPKN